MKTERKDVNILVAQYIYFINKWSANSLVYNLSSHLSIDQLTSPYWPLTNHNCETVHTELEGKFGLNYSLCFYTFISIPWPWDITLHNLLKLFYENNWQGEFDKLNKVRKTSSVQIPSFFNKNKNNESIFSYLFRFKSLFIPESFDINI